MSRVIVALALGGCGGGTLLVPEYDPSGGRDADSGVIDGDSGEDTDVPDDAAGTVRYAYYYADADAPNGEATACARENAVYLGDPAGSCPGCTFAFDVDVENLSDVGEGSCVEFYTLEVPADAGPYEIVGLGFAPYAYVYQGRYNYTQASDVLMVGVTYGGYPGTYFGPLLWDTDYTEVSWDAAASRLSWRGEIASLPDAPPAETCAGNSAVPHTPVAPTAVGGGRLWCTSGADQLLVEATEGVPVYVAVDIFDSRGADLQIEARDSSGCSLGVVSGNTLCGNGKNACAALTFTPTASTAELFVSITSTESCAGYSVPYTVLVEDPTVRVERVEPADPPPYRVVYEGEITVPSAP